MASQRLASIKQLWPDFDVTEGDIKQPTTEFVITFLEKMLDEIGLLDFALQGHTSDKVLNQVSIADGSRKVVLCTIFRHIFSKIKGPQFGIEDIIEPDPRRFGKQVDILLNLVRYLEFHFAKVFNNVMEEMDGLSQLRNDCLQDIDELTERRNKIALEKKALSLQLQSQMGEKEKYRAILSKIKGKTLEKTAEYDKLNGINQRLEADISALEKAIYKENEEIEGLKENIVLSPDAVSREKVELMSRRKDLEERHAAIKSTVDEKSHFASKLEQLCSAMEPIPEQLRDLAEKQILAKNLEEGFHEDEINYKKILDKFEAYKKDCEDTAQQVSKMKENIVEQERHMAAVLASLNNELLNANRALQEAEEKHVQKGVKQVLIAQEIQIWKDKITSLDEEEKLLDERFFAAKQKIENEVTQFHQKIVQKVGHIKGQLQMPADSSE